MATVSIMCAISAMAACLLVSYLVGDPGRPAEPLSSAESMESVLYYALLVPLSLPVTAFFVYLNWLAMEVFSHN